MRDVYKKNEFDPSIMRCPSCGHDMRHPTKYEPHQTYHKGDPIVYSVMCTAVKFHHETVAKHITKEQYDHFSAYSEAAARQILNEQNMKQMIKDANDTSLHYKLSPNDEMIILYTYNSLKDEYYLSDTTWEIGTRIVEQLNLDVKGLLPNVSWKMRDV